MKILKFYNFIKEKLEIKSPKDKKKKKAIEIIGWKTY